MNLNDYSKEMRGMEWGSRLSVRSSNQEPRMSHMGHSRVRRETGKE